MQLGINETALKKIYERFGDSFAEMKKLINKSFLSKEIKVKYIGLLDERRKLIWGVN